MAKYNLYLVIAIVGLAIITSGCTGGQDVSSVVKALPEVQQFMKEHPNAKIIVTYWSKDEVAKSIQEISQQCDKAITPAAMYKATISEGDLKIVSWINADDQTVICSTTEGNQTAPTSTAPIQTVTATPLATPIVTKPMPTPTPPITGYTVEFLSAPATAVSGQSFMVSWRVNSPVQENINHTAVHYGPDSKSEPLTL
ncbi:MAG: hypothetical protein O8C56_02870, partial [Candidatus Methanoperedens sp.]|nr:hypothetical protein [Candidatus Methanoperedens sp.]